MTKRSRTIKRELFTLYLVIIIAFLVIVGLLVGYRLYNASKKNILNNSMQLALSVGNSVNMYIEETNETLTMIGENLSNEINDDLMNNAGVRAHMASFLEHHTDINKIRILDNNKTVQYILPYSETQMGSNLKYAPFLNEVTDTLLWSDVTVSGATGNRSLAVTRRLKNGYFVVNLSVEKIISMLKDLSENTMIILYDDNGTVIASTDPKHALFRENHSNRDYLKKALSGRRTTERFVHTHQGRETEMLGSSLPLKNGWVIAVSRPVADAFEMVYTMSFNLVSATLLIIAVGLIVFYIFSKRIEKPIEMLVTWAKKLSQGIYIGDNERVTSYDELNRLSSTFKTMSEKIEARENELTRQREELNASNEELESYNEEMTALNQELEASERAANASNKAKSEFLANMSHELRTPLNGIIGFSEILKSTQLSSEQREYISNVLYSSRHLLELISDILDFSRIEAGRLTLEKVDTDLRDQLNKAFRLIKPSAEEKGLALYLSIDEKITGLVKTDPMRLNQVIINLLSNAVKFTSEGSIKLEARLLAKSDLLSDRESGQEEMLVEFSVTDTGIGIREEMQEKIFEIFTQVDSTITRKYGGTGLGLTISNSILEQMGSRLEIESEEGKGTRFSFQVLFEYADEKSESPQKPADEKSENILPDDSLKGKKILLVEDDPINAKLTKTFLKRNFPETEVFLAKNGNRAVELFKEERPTLVLMDVHIPGKDGLEVTSEIRAIDNGGKGTKIIGLSADVREKNVRQALEKGMDHFVTKPVDREELLKAIRS